MWQLAHRAHPSAVTIADRHYNRQKPGTPQFVPPGACLVLRTERAVWVTSWPLPQFTKHAWAGAWINSTFRNESDELSSALIREAVAMTRWYWPDIPVLGMVTFVDPTKIRGTNPGYCYLKAGFTRLRQRTKGGLVVLQMLPSEMPEAAQPGGTTLRLIA